MFVSIYYKPSLFNAHTMILIVHIFMNVNKLCLNQKHLYYLFSTHGKRESNNQCNCSIHVADGNRIETLAFLWTVFMTALHDDSPFLDVTSSCWFQHRSCTLKYKKKKKKKVLLWQFVIRSSSDITLMFHTRA